MNVLKVDHIAIAVKNIEQASKFYQQSLGLKFNGEEIIPENNVKIAFLKCGELDIELLQSLREGEGSIDKFIEENGEGLYHIALEVDDLEDSIKILETQNFKFKSPYPSKGARNTTIAFLEESGTNGAVVELVEGKPFTKSS